MAVPRHVAIIPDGNRRWAKNPLKYKEAYDLGGQNLIDIVTYFFDAGVDYVSFYAFSLKNFSRGDTEKKLVTNLMRNYLPKMKALIKQKNLRVIFAGKIELFPKDLYDEFTKLENQTSSGKKTIIPLIAYSGKDDRNQAAKKWVGAGMKGDVDDYLYASKAPGIDLLIRTGNVSRTSGYLPAHSEQAELYFLEKFWPDFLVEDAKQALTEYNARERRFGK
ncbi:MAG: di-trans,poly-cis-decaprenylcistransferase [Candidatus Altiarchaeota archaeon]|nr:di-trans,poly-cis-decaprenylcistransferase [Candidatus Altiarchaeota archaeon]